MFFCVLEEGPLVDVDVSSKVAVTGGEDTGRSPPPRHGGADAADALGPPEQKKNGGGGSTIHYDVINFTCET